MANVLRREKQILALNCLVEGNSIRSTERVAGIHRDTIMRLGVRVGEACARMMDERLRDIDSQRIQIDEIWGFVGKKQKHIRPSDDPDQVGDVWTWVCIDADTKLVPSFAIGNRDQQTAKRVLTDLRSRINGRVQISTDGLGSYIEAIRTTFGSDADYAQIVKSYEAEPLGSGRYSPPKVKSAEKKVVRGRPDPKHISTSYVERNNLTMRTKMRRLTRLTNAFSKKRRNFEAAVALHFAHYNFVSIHGTLKVSPAMEAGVTNSLWSMDDLLREASGY